MFLSKVTMKYLKDIFNRKHKEKINLLTGSKQSSNTLIIKNKIEQWQDSGDIYYLLDTIKLTYESEEGLITIEKLSQQSFDSLMKGELPLSNQVQISDCMTLSVCAVSQQHLATQNRTKAIANAALFRVFPKAKLQSQAQFQHAQLPLDSKLNALTRYNFKRGINTVYGLTLKNFIKTLTIKNNAYIAKHGNKSSINSDNFESIFTNYELERLKSIPGY